MRRLMVGSDCLVAFITAAFSAPAATQSSQRRRISALVGSSATMRLRRCSWSPKPMRMSAMMRSSLRSVSLAPVIGARLRRLAVVLGAGGAADGLADELGRLVDQRASRRVVQAGAVEHELGL